MDGVDQMRMDAAEAMKAGRLGDAILLYEKCTTASPDDLKSLLHLGICHLLNRSEALFLSLFEEAKALRARLGHIADDVQRVFSQYEGLVKKVTAAALVMGTVAVASSGCGSAHKYSGGVYDELDATAHSSDSATDDAGPSDSDTVSSAHRYSGGVAFETKIQE